MGDTISGTRLSKSVPQCRYSRTTSWRVKQGLMDITMHVQVRSGQLWEMSDSESSWAEETSRYLPQPTLGKKTESAVNTYRRVIRWINSGDDR